jgi:hypothetical protein
MLKFHFSSNDTAYIPVYPIGAAAVIDTYGPVRLQMTSDGYYTVYNAEVLQCATPDKATALREFWSVCGFD